MSGRRRTLSEDERELFEETLKDAKPLRRRKRTSKPPSPKKVIVVSKPAASAAPTKKAARQFGIDGNTAERLMRGQLEPEAKLDLHGLTEAAAHRALITFLRSASARKLRLILVVTGKGGKQPRPDEPFDLELNRRARGVLRMMTPRWLAEPELAGFVADVRPSNRRHGGEGALYVYLRKSR